MGPLDEIHINGLPAAGDEQLTESGRAKAYNTCSTWRLVAEEQQPVWPLNWPSPSNGISFLLPSQECCTRALGVKSLRKA